MAEIVEQNPIELMSKPGKLKGLIDLKGGMLARLQYLKADNVWVDVLHKAPWLKEDYFNDAAGLERHLAGEWACVPFGWVSEDTELFKANASHGMPCHNEWQVEAISEDRAEIVLRYSYSEVYPLSHVVRAVTLTDEGVRFSYTVVARKSCEVPMGAHPVFPLNGVENELDLQIAGDGMVYGIECEPKVSRFETGAYFKSLKEIPVKESFRGLDGNTKTASIAKLPFAYDTEEIVQMIHPQGQAILTYNNKGLRLILEWESEKIPSCLLWISNRGRKFEPWNSQNCCLGIEPIASAWDLAPQSVASLNPIKEKGVATAVKLQAETPFTFNYELKVEAL